METEAKLSHEAAVVRLTDDELLEEVWELVLDAADREPGNQGPMLLQEVLERWAFEPYMAYEERRQLKSETPAQAHLELEAVREYAGKRAALRRRIHQAYRAGDDG
jgi:hypothetical protein